MFSAHFSFSSWQLQQLFTTVFQTVLRKEAIKTQGEILAALK